MFSSIILNNFESHLDTTLDLTPGINLITGTSDHGKSSIFRGLNWVCFNRPVKNEGFRNDTLPEGTEFSVSITLNDNTTIKRFKNSNTNGYTLSTQDEPLSAINKDVPKEIEDLLNIQDVNIQSQHSPYFLLNENSGAVAKAFNEMIQLSVMDLCIAEAKREVKDASDALKATEIELKRVESELKKVPDVSKLEEIYNILVSLTSTIETDSSTLNQLTYFFDSIQTLSKDIQILDNNLSEIDTLKEDLSTIVKSNNYLLEEYTNKKELYTTIKDINLELIKYQDLPEQSDIDELTTLTQSIVNQSNNYTDQKRLYLTYSKLEEELNTLNKDIKRTDLKYNKLLSKYDVCPICSSIISK